MGQAQRSLTEKGFSAGLYLWNGKVKPNIQILSGRAYTKVEVGEIERRQYAELDDSDEQSPRHGELIDNFPWVES
ncbi:MAG: hypothetical protein V6Z81_11165 [Parvularculales bacterium]